MQSPFQPFIKIYFLCLWGAPDGVRGVGFGHVLGCAKTVPRGFACISASKIDFRCFLYASDAFSDPDLGVLKCARIGYVLCAIYVYVCMCVRVRDCS